MLASAARQLVCRYLSCGGENTAKLKLKLFMRYLFVVVVYCSVNMLFTCCLLQCLQIVYCGVY